MADILKSVKKFSSEDEEEDDAFLSELTEEELVELNESLGDELLLPSDQAKDHTTKKPTGTFNRSSLMSFLQEEAKKNEDIVDPNYVPYVKKTRGKVYQPKVQEPVVNTNTKRVHDVTKGSTKAPNIPCEKFDDENDELLDGLNEEELAELNEVLDDTMLPARMR